MTNTNLFVVTGVSGHTGAAVASALLAGKHAVRVIVRDAAKGAAWKARGAEVAVADVGDRPALAAALKGASGAYLLLPPPAWGQGDLVSDRAAKTASIAGAVADAKPGHVVALSSCGAQHAAGTGPIVALHAFEAALTKTGVPLTIVRAGNFMENWEAMLKSTIDAGALYYGARSGLAFPQVAAADIGKLVAKLLVEGKPAGVVQIAGPAELSIEDVAATLAKIVGKPIKAVQVPTAAVSQAMTGMGASKEFADGMAELLDGLNAGLLAWTAPEIHRGTTTLEQSLRAQLGK